MFYLVYVVGCKKVDRELFCYGVKCYKTAWLIISSMYPFKICINKCQQAKFNFIVLLRNWNSIRVSTTATSYVSCSSFKVYGTWHSIMYKLNAISYKCINQKLLKLLFWYALKCYSVVTIIRNLLFVTYYTFVKITLMRLMSILLCQK